MDKNNNYSNPYSSDEFFKEICKAFINKESEYKNSHDWMINIAKMDTIMQAISSVLDCIVPLEDTPRIIKNDFDSITGTIYEWRCAAKMLDTDSAEKRQLLSKAISLSDTFSIDVRTDESFEIEMSFLNAKIPLN